MLKKIFACGAALIIGTTLAFAAPESGKTPSVRIDDPVTPVAEACNATIFAQALNITIDRANTNLFYSADVYLGIDLLTFQTLMGTRFSDATLLNVEYDAIITVTIAPGQEAGWGGDAGTYIFAYKDGCYVGQTYSKYFPDPEAIDSIVSVNKHTVMSSSRPDFSRLQYGLTLDD